MNERTDLVRELLELKIGHVTEIAKLRVELTDKALQLQRIEYERRLDLLNHEQARLAADRERFLPRELYDANNRDQRQWRDSVNTWIAANQGKSTGQQATVAAIYAAAGFIVTLIVIVGAVVALAQ